MKRSSFDSKISKLYVNKKKIYWVFGFMFILIFLIGIALRFHGLTTQSYWLDELYSASEIQLMAGNTTITFSVEKNA